MFWISYVAAFLSTVLVVGAAAFLLSRRNTALARTIAVYGLTAAVWIGGNAAADVSYTVEALLLTSSIAYLGGALNLLFFLILVDFIVDGRMPEYPRLALYAIPTIGMSAFAFSDFAILGTYFPPDAPAQIIPGPLYTVTFFILIAALSYSVIRLMRTLSKESREARRIQLSYVLVGLMLSLLGEIVFDIVLPLMGELRFYTLGPITSTFFIAGCAYAAIASRHFDIRLIAQRGMVYTFLLALIIAAYAALVSLVLLLTPFASETSVYISAGLTVIAGIFGTPVIERYFTRFTDGIFFKEAYDSAEALHALSELLYRHIELPELVRHAEDELARILRASSVRIEYAEHGKDEPDLDAMASGHAIAVPIREGNSYIGSIHASPKKSGDAYTLQDRKLLETFAYQAATAFSRAELHEKTKRHAHELERTVAERTRELRKAREHERQTLAELAHNLQTPLAVFQVRLEQLKQSAPGACDLRSLEQPMRRLSEFIYDLLALAKLESERPQARAGVDLSAIVLEIAEELEVIAEAAQVEVTSSILPGVTVTGDERRLREAILNVANNALTYQRESGDRKITIALARSGKGAQLTVADTGRGIAAADLPRVFERFYRGADSPRGNGLGLAIAKRIIERHGGSIAIESAEGAGTRVSIRLPADAS